MNMNELEYQRELDALHFTQTQKQALADRVAEAAQHPAASRRPIRRIAVVAVAAVLALAIGVGASGMLKSAAEAFAGVFGSSQTETEIVNRIGKPIGASADSDGITISADAIVGDKYNACIVYTVKKNGCSTWKLPKNVPLTNLNFSEAYCTLTDRGGCSGSAWFTDSNPADNVVQYVESVTTDSPDGLKTGDVTARFHTLSYFDPQTEKQVPLSDGTWKFRFNVSYKDSSVVLHSEKGSFAQNGMDFIVKSVSISPVALRVSYSVDSEAKWSNQPSGKISKEDEKTEECYLGSVKLLVHCADGHTIDMTNAGGSVSPKGGKTDCTKGGVFEEILDLNDVTSVTVGGIPYPVNVK